MRFISFEGTEGSGKSTLIRGLSQRLSSLGIHHRVTREPGGSPVAEQIRNLILNHSMDSMTELFLYQAARAEHLENTIRPALHAGEWVLCDRFTDSTLAYQGTARGIDRKKIAQLNRIATGGIRPHLTFWLDLPPALGLARATDANRFEEEGVRFQSLVRKGFAQNAREEPKRICKIGVEKLTAEQVLARVWKELERRKWVAKK